MTEKAKLPGTDVLPLDGEAEPLGRSANDSSTMPRWARKIVTPIEAFLQVEASSGLVLIVTAILAVALANSPLSGRLHEWLEAPVGGHIDQVAVEHTVHFWINEGLMTIFFFVVGLEIRREIHEGELSTVKRAALPVAAALGGMVAPALLYLAVTGGHPEMRRGWGVPMATDIAFAVGVLTLLGKRVPPALRVLLLALAIIDDIGSIAVIATFYSSGLALSGLLVAAAGVAAIVLLQRLGVRTALLYVVPGIVVWAGFLRSGVHPTIAGVVVGLLTPARSEGGAASPATLLQTSLHPWVAFVIMPLFAFANAGVTIDRDTLELSALGLGVLTGLVAGKPLGVLTACFLAVRTKVAVLPRGIGPRELVVLGLVAGIGFTMALFVAALAFPDGPRLEESKLAVLAASAFATLVGLGVGRALLRAPYTSAAAATASEAEASDES